MKFFILIRPGPVYFFIWIAICFGIFMAGMPNGASPLLATGPRIVEDALAIDLNGPATGTGYAATFIEDDPPVAITSSELTISTGPESLELVSATIVLAGNPDEQLEAMEITADLEETGLGKRLRYQNDALALELTGSAPAETYQSVLRTVTYVNTSNAPDTTDRLISFTISDGTAESAPAISTIAISAVNDAPLLDNSGEMRLEPVLEDDQTQIGTLVADIIASAESTGIDRITDPDLTDPEGIAVIEAGESNGTWQFSTDAGSSWRNFGIVSNSAAILLNTATRVRYLPNENYGGQATIVFRAWDQTTEATNGARADATINGDTSAFSTATESASVDVLLVDDPPVVDMNGALPGTTYAAAFLSEGTPVPMAAPDAYIGDVDSSSLISLTVKLTNRPNGVDESLIFIEPRAVIISKPYDPVTGEIQFSGQAPIADYSDILNGLSYQNVAANMSTDERIITFVASDGTNSGPTTQARLMPRLTNSAPSLNAAAEMRFKDIMEDELNSPGESVSSLLASSASWPITDNDPGDAQGFAVTNVENINGTWQFSIDAGQTWLPVGNVTDENARLLNQASLLRFVPEPDFSGESRRITVRAWDQSSGANGIAGADVTKYDESSAFSANAVSIPIVIQAVNDAPTLSLSSSATAQYVEGNGPVVIAGPALDLVDKDNEFLSSARVILAEILPNEPDLLATAGSSAAIAVSYDQSAGVLQLNGRATVSDYRAALRAATFNNLSQDPVEGNREITFQVNDGEDVSNIVTGNVVVQAVNDAPILDLNGELIEGQEQTAYYDEDDAGLAPPLPIAGSAMLQDVDDTAIIGATVVLRNRPNGTAETLAASTTGTNITATSLENGARIEFNGQDTLGAYQQVIRSLTYNNTVPHANRALRRVELAVRDASGAEATSVATIVVRPQFVIFPVIMQEVVDGPPAEEPNDDCAQAVSLFVNRDYSFQPDDKDDWFSFHLFEAAETTVTLSDFAPVDGQILVAEGECGSLTLRGQNGNFEAVKEIQLGLLDEGRYYIWIINDGATNLGMPYKLRISTG